MYAVYQEQNLPWLTQQLKSAREPKSEAPIEIWVSKERIEKLTEMTDGVEITVLRRISSALISVLRRGKAA